VDDMNLRDCEGENQKRSGNAMEYLCAPRSEKEDGAKAMWARSERTRVGSNFLELRSRDV
jgi:hypothetical protein